MASVNVTTLVCTCVTPPKVSTLSTLRTAMSQTHRILPGLSFASAGSSDAKVRVEPSRLTARSERSAATLSMATVAGFHWTSKRFGLISSTVLR